MLKIRLRRMGSRHRPFFRVVVSDSRLAPSGSAVDEVGYYDPSRKPALLHLDSERVDHWVGRGAQLSSTVRRLVRQSRSAPAATAAATPPVEAASPAATPAPAPATPPPAAEGAAAEAAAPESGASEQAAPAAEAAQPAEETDAASAAAEPEEAAKD